MARACLSRMSQAVVNASRASWSPDGRWLAYSSGGLFAPRNLFVVNVDSGQVRQVTQFTRSSEGVVTQAWLPDNRHLIVSFRAAPWRAAPTDLGVLERRDGFDCATDDERHRQLRRAQCVGRRVAHDRHRDAIPA